VKFFSVGVLSLFAFAVTASAGVSVEPRLRQELAKTYTDATISFSAPARWTAGQPPEVISALEILSESPRGEIQFQVNGGVAAGTATFAAWKEVWISKRRVLPGERLKAEDFVPQKINIAAGMARDVRGLILGKEIDLSMMESRQTVLEGQFILSSAVQRVPDVRRGEAVRVRLVSGDVAISTPGTAEEPAYLDQQVRVMTQKSKRVLLGTLRKDGIVEVKL